MQNPIKAIYQWQKEAGNLEQPYDDFLESSFQVEEALEGFEHVDYALAELDAYTSCPKGVSRAIIEAAQRGKPRGSDSTCVWNEISDVDRFDKAIDAVIFAIGSMGKLGLTPQQIQRGLLLVNHANMQKLGMPRDEHGKLIKPKGFVGPEEQLQKILDERN